MGMVSYAGSERLKSGSLKETQNVYNDVPGDLTPRPGMVDSDNFTGVANAPITLFFYQRSPNFRPQGGSGSGAQSDTQAFTVAPANTNPGYSSGTTSGGLGGGAGAGGLKKHDHTTDTNTEGGYLKQDTGVSNDDALTRVGTIGDSLRVGTDSGSNGVLRLSDTAVELYSNGTANEVANYNKLVRPEIIGKVKNADIAIGATGTLEEVDLAGTQLASVEYTTVTNLTGGIMGLASYYKMAWDWKGNAYAYTQVSI